MKKGTVKKRTHRYSFYLKELRPIWKKNPEKLPNMLKDMVEKKSTFLVESIAHMEFVDRYLSLNKQSLKKVHFYAFEELQTWVRMQIIEYSAKVILWLRNLTYESQYWATDKYHLKYIDRQIAVRERYLNTKRSTNEFELNKPKIYKLLQNGKLPSIKEFDPVDIGSVVGIIKDIENLKAKRKDLLEENQPASNKVPMENKKDSENQPDIMQVQLPHDFLKSIQQDLIKKGLDSIALPQPSSNPEPKLYTRQETAKLMQISLPTLDDLTKQGIITAHRIESTKLKRYRFKDIEAALIKIETKSRMRRKRNR